MGGFFISNKLDTDYKVGSSFKKDEVIAQNKTYFKGSGFSSEYAVGCLAKVAMTQGPWTYEDSTLITEKFSDDMTSYITMKKHLVLGPNSNIDYICKKGQEVKTGDTLIKFENSFDEKEINTMLRKLGTDYKESISELSKNIIKSKYTGVVEDIKIYWNTDIDELSPSLQKIVKSYCSSINKRKNIAKNSDRIIFPATDKIDSPDGKIKGIDIGTGILIEFYIKYKDILSVGDKLTHFVALKGIVSNVVAQEEAPYAESRPEEPIDAIFSPLSVVSRMTNSIFYAMYTNKVLIELKRKIEDIYK